MMKPFSILGLLALSVCLLSPVEAGNNGGNDDAKKKKQEREKKQAEREKKRDAVKAFMEPRDKNNDGSLSMDEFLEGETDKEEGKKKFDQFNKNGDRSLTKSEIEAMLGL